MHFICHSFNSTSTTQSTAFMWDFCDICPSVHFVCLLFFKRPSHPSVNGIQPNNENHTLRENIRSNDMSNCTSDMLGKSTYFASAHLHRHQSYNLLLCFFSSLCLTDLSLFQKITIIIATCTHYSIPIIMHSHSVYSIHTLRLLLTWHWRDDQIITRPLLLSHAELLCVKKVVIVIILQNDEWLWNFFLNSTHTTPLTFFYTDRDGHRHLLLLLSLHTFFVLKVFPFLFNDRPFAVASMSSPLPMSVLQRGNVRQADKCVHVQRPLPLFHVRLPVWLDFLLVLFSGPTMHNNIPNQVSFSLHSFFITTKYQSVVSSEDSAVQKSTDLYLVRGRRYVIYYIQPYQVTCIHDQNPYYHNPHPSPPLPFCPTILLSIPFIMYRMVIHFIMILNIFIMKRYYLCTLCTLHMISSSSHAIFSVCLGKSPRRPAISLPSTS